MLGDSFTYNFVFGDVGGLVENFILYSNKKWNVRTRKDLWSYAFRFNRLNNVFGFLTIWWKGTDLKGRNVYPNFHQYEDKSQQRAQSPTHKWAFMKT